MNTYISSNLFNYYTKGEKKNMAIVIDGIIGAGKSTVAQFLSSALEVPLYQELNDTDNNTLAQRMLDLFYADQKRWSAIIQVMFLNDRFRDIKAIEAIGNRAIIDRSIYGDEIFAKTIKDRGQMSDDEFTIYRELLHNMLQHIKTPELLIYVDVSVDTAMDRIVQRNRSTEAALIPRDYMEDLNQNYEDWYDHYDLSPKIKIDLNHSQADINGDLSPEVKEMILKKLKPFFPAS